jgi:hypothetical protein
MELLPSVSITSFFGFCRQKYFASVIPEPRTKPNFGIAVARRRIDVIHPPFGEVFHRLIGNLLVHLGKRRRPEKDSGAFVAGSTEWPSW